MELIINGASRQVVQATTVDQLLKELGYQDALVAVAINRTCIRRTEFNNTQLFSGDEVEILAPMAGG